MLTLNETYIKFVYGLLLLLYYILHRVISKSDCINFNNLCLKYRSRSCHALSICAEIYSPSILDLLSFSKNLSLIVFYSIVISLTVKLLPVFVFTSLMFPDKTYYFLISSKRVIQDFCFYDAFIVKYHY